MEVGDGWMDGGGWDVSHRFILTVEASIGISSWLIAFVWRNYFYLVSPFSTESHMVGEIWLIWTTTESGGRRFWKLERRKEA